MIEITSTELRKNFGKYLSIAVEKKVQVLVRYRNKGVFSLTTEPQEVSPVKKMDVNNKYFDQQEVIESIRRGKADVKAGRVRKFTTIQDLWEGIQ
ncbi:MAG: hypothetical protein HGA97_10760 [Chlorobiaceae bacterium]|nr:hypothetical protein [Chlorobiaceae bacterium]